MTLKNMKSSGFMVIVVILMMTNIFMTNGASAEICFGNNYEQQMPVPGAQPPVISIERIPFVIAGKSTLLTTNVDSEGIPFYQWCTNRGRFEADPGYPNYSAVRFIAPPVSEDNDTVIITVQIGNTLGYVDSDTASFRVIPSGNKSFLYDNWRDAEKSQTNPDDDLLCWAAAAANILDWGGWDIPFFDSEQDIFYNFQEYWTNDVNLMEFAWRWWFDGTDTIDKPGWAQANDGGGYVSDYDFSDYFYEDWAIWDSALGLWTDGIGLISSIDDYLHSGYGVTLTTYTNSEDIGHALSVWGYEYDDNEGYTGIWVTDSDDYMTDLKLLSVSLIDGLWYLDQNNDYGYQDWFIGGVQALDRRNPVPEPGTLILIGLGLLNLMMFVRRRANNTK